MSFTVCDQRYQRYSRTFTVTRLARSTIGELKSYLRKHHDGVAEEQQQIICCERKLGDEETIEEAEIEASTVVQWVQKPALVGGGVVRGHAVGGAAAQAGPLDAEGRLLAAEVDRISAELAAERAAATAGDAEITEAADALAAAKQEWTRTVVHNEDLASADDAARMLRAAVACRSADGLPTKRLARDIVARHQALERLEAAAATRRQSVARAQARLTQNERALERHRAAMLPPHGGGGGGGGGGGAMEFLMGQMLKQAAAANEDSIVRDMLAVHALSDAQKNRFAATNGTGVILHALREHVASVRVVETAFELTVELCRCGDDVANAIAQRCLATFVDTTRFARGMAEDAIVQHAALRAVAALAQKTRGAALAVIAADVVGVVAENALRVHAANPRVVGAALSLFFRLMDVDDAVGTTRFTFVVQASTDFPREADVQTAAFAFLLKAAKNGSAPRRISRDVLDQGALAIMNAIAGAERVAARARVAAQLFTLRNFYNKKIVPTRPESDWLPESIIVLLIDPGSRLSPRTRVVKCVSDLTSTVIGSSLGMVQDRTFADTTVFVHSAKSPAPFTSEFAACLVHSAKSAHKGYCGNSFEYPDGQSVRAGMVWSPAATFRILKTNES
jgi:hypothetical protein